MEGQNAPQPNSLRWDHSAEEIVSLTDELIKDQTAIIESVINLEGARSFKNTIEPIAKFEYDCGKIGNNMQFYKHMSTSKELRDASLAASKKLDDFGIELWMRYDFFQAMKQYKDASVESKEWDTLDAESQRFVDRILRDFDRNGMQFPEEKRQQIKTLLTQISDLERDCSNNINNDKTKCEFEEKDLEGIPEKTVDKFEKVPEKEGWRYVSMKYPEVLPGIASSQALQK